MAPRRTVAQVARARRRKKKYSAMSIQRAWRARARKKRGSLVVRTVKSNRRAIKQIKKDRQLKFVNSGVASVRTNWCGQIISATPIDNYGMNQRSVDWVGPPIVFPSLPAQKYMPVVQQPIVVPLAGTPISGSATLHTSNDNTREGNDIVMSHLTLKITMAGGFVSNNGGLYQGLQQKQHLHALIVLDRDPGDEPASLNTATPIFEALSCPGSLYLPTPDNTFVPGSDSNIPGRDFLRVLPQTTANPPGVATANPGSKNLIAQSFYSKDHASGPKSRFKVLKKVSLSCWQQANAVGSVPTARDGPALRTQSTKTVTIKSPYKFHFDADLDLVPSNQNLLIFYFSDTPTNRSGSATVAPTDYCEPPYLSVVSRFSFRDP